MAIVLIPSSRSGNKASEALATRPLAQRLVGKATKVQVQAVSRKGCPLQGLASTFLQASASAKSILHRDKETGPCLTTPSLLGGDTAAIHPRSPKYKNERQRK